MVKKGLITGAVFLFIGGMVFAAGFALNPTVGLPQVIEDHSACPAVGCAFGACHGYEDIPEPDGIHEMYCPETSCASTECHAWDTLVTRYNQPSDASLNVWILAPVVLVIVLVLVIRKL